MSALTERMQVAGVDVSPDHFIGGERVASGRRFEDISPIDSEVIGEISRAGEAEVDLAVRAAHAGKASRAARTARSTSASPAREISAVTSPSIGEMSSKRSRLATRSPPM